MKKEKLIIVCSLALFLTSIAIYKRFFSFGTMHEFSLEFGRSPLNPRFFFFSVLSAFALSAPINYKVGKKAYRQISGYYENLRDRRAFFKELKAGPIITIAFNKPSRTSKHLGLAFPLAVALNMFAKNTLYLLGISICTILATTFIVIWKIYN